MFHLSRKMRRIFFLLLITFLVLHFFILKKNVSKINDFSHSQKLITLSDDGLNFQKITTAEKISDFLKENNITISEKDSLSPDQSTPLFSGTKIEILRSRKIKIEVDGKKIENYTTQKTVFGALQENSIKLSRLDKVSPEKYFPPSYASSIIVTRINVEEVLEKKPIDFKIIIKKDSSLGWREKEIKVPGEKGSKEIKYRITYKNSREISRIVLEESIEEEPTNQEEIQGTYIKTGKAKQGQGTWYAQPDYLKQKFSPIINNFAASTTIPKGSYAKVTNLANGKSVIVQINDYGPQGKGRIIDLEKETFAKIASLGAGVIGVKVEEVLN